MSSTAAIPIRRRCWRSPAGLAKPQAIASRRFCLRSRPVGEVGQTPWSAAKPLLVDMAKAERELGYRAAISWAEALPLQVRWLIEATRDRDWREVLTRGADYLKFDYESEDGFVADLPKA